MKQVDDDSDDSDQEAAGTPYKPSSDLPALDDDQPINNFTLLVLVERPRYVSKKEDSSRRITFTIQVPMIEGIDIPDESATPRQSNSSSTLNSPTKSPISV